MEERKEKNKARSKRGITLIALIITVVIMLILAGVAIGAVVGGDGLFNKIEQATKIYENVSEDEKFEIHDMVTQIDIYLQDTNNPIVKDKAKINVIVNENQTYDGRLKGTYYNPIIPKGFAPINENGADWGSVDGYKKGLVITDEVNEEGNSIGNEFVWVPVDGTIVKFERYDFGKGNIEIPVSSYLETLPEDLRASVSENCGFYIARFEVGQAVNEKPVSKQGATTYTKVNWNNAKISAEAMYPSSDTVYGVISTLIYGVQWDTALKFIGAYDVGEGGYDTYAIDSTGMGNYNGINGGDDISSISSPAECGARDAFRQKNIYDMAGNVWEWTMEEYGTTHLYRGACFDNNPVIDPASYRRYDVTGGDKHNTKGVGFRVALYIK